MNIKEVAERAGVSITTISRVLNAPEKVNVKTKEKVLATMEEMNYTPNWFARNLQHSRTNLIGVILPDNLQQSNMELAKGIEKIALQKECNIILCNTGYDRHIENEHIQRLIERSIDGLILISSTLTKEDLDIIKDKAVPFVLVEKTAASKGENIVYTNNDTATYEAVSYLAEMGRKTIAIITPLKSSFTNEEKLRGYREALKDWKLEIDKEIILKAEDTLEGGFAATNKLINSDKKPDAIFVCTDTMAFGAIEAIRQNNLTSDEIGVIGFDGLEVGAVVEPKLTTVKRPSYRMGLTAGRMLFDLIENETGEDDEQAVMLQSKLLIRKSCGNRERLREIW